MTGPGGALAQAPIRKGYADTGLGQMHYRLSEAAEGSGPAVVFFHRTPVTSASFGNVMTRLAGWRTMVAFDTPGFGESAVPPDDTPMSAFVGAFLAALDRLGIGQCHLVGHHTGAHFACELARAEPGRVLSLMIDGAMVMTQEERGPPAPPPPPPLIDRTGDYARSAWDFLVPYYTVFDPACIHQELVGALASTFTRAACMRLVRVHDMIEALGGVQCPVLASAAIDDVFVDHLARIAQARPEAVIRTYGKAGIASPELQAEAFAALVREAAALGEG